MLTVDHWQLALIYLDPDAYDLSEAEVACKVDADCLLVDTLVSVISDCTSVEGDQSWPQWQAVNKAWYVEGQSWGRSPEDHGRLPCDQTPVASVPYTAHCQASVCGKAPAGGGSR